MHHDIIMYSILHFLSSNIKRTLSKRNRIVLNKPPDSCIREATIVNIKQQFLNTKAEARYSAPLLLCIKMKTVYCIMYTAKFI